MQTTPQAHCRRTLSAFGRASGFALVASLSIMAVLVLIGVALFTLASVATRNADIASARVKAESNAKMALMIAIGDLQKNLGPDKRVTARGLTMAQHPGLEADVTTDSAKAWWLGAASSDASETLDGTHPVVWLVSGLDRELSAQEQIENDPPFLRPIRMFDTNSIDTALTGGEAITAGAVPVRDGNQDPTSAYAYFVDDEGMKAQIVARNPNLSNDDSSPDRPGGSVFQAITI